MKRMLSFISAIALTTTLVQANSVESQNIVGYSTTQIQGNVLKILGVPFVNVGDVEIDIQDLIVSGPVAGDNIQFFTDTGYQSYLYANNTFIDGDPTFTDQGPGWNVGAWRAERSVLPGEAYWYVSSANRTLVAAGEVIMDEYPMTGLGQGSLFLISSPHPMVADIQEINFDGVQPGDSIQFFTGSGYQSYLYANNTFIDGDPTFTDQGPGWNFGAWRAEKNVELGEGFWLVASGQVDVTFPNP